MSVNSIAKVRSLSSGSHLSSSNANKLSKVMVKFYDKSITYVNAIAIPFAIWKIMAQVSSIDCNLTQYIRNIGESYLKLSHRREVHEHSPNSLLDL